MSSTFAEALIDAMEARGTSQSRLADLIGVRQNTISRWLSDDPKYAPEPPRDAVFAMEVALGLPPGNLSRHLGYLPLGVEMPEPTILDAIRAQTQWTDAQREILAFTAATFDREANERNVSKARPRPRGAPAPTKRKATSA